MSARKETILVAEDDPNDQLLIEMAFERIGLKEKIQVVPDGAEAIAYLRGEGNYADREQFPYPTFLITDLKMPRLDGFGVLEFLHNNPQWRIIPIVVMSASTDTDDIKKSYSLGASSYHVKPRNLEGLCHQLQVLHQYWVTCELPEVDVSGKQLQTESAGKLGERFPQEVSSESKPHR